jgi:lipoate-protein ligase A
MQHGSVLLATSPHAPVLAGIDALSGKKLSAEETCRAITAGFARATGWQLSLADWTPQERRRIEELVRDKYGRDAWNCKR